MNERKFLFIYFFFNEIHACSCDLVWSVRNLKLKINQDRFDNLFICGVGYKEWMFISFQLCKVLL